VKFIIAFSLSVLLVISSDAGARSCTIEGLIKIDHELEGEPGPVTVRFSFPDKYKKYEFSGVALQRNKIKMSGKKESSSFVYIVPETEKQEGKQIGVTQMGLEELALWSLTVSYAFPLEKTSTRHAVECNAIVTTTSLEHAMKRNGVDNS